MASTRRSFLSGLAAVFGIAATKPTITVPVPLKSAEPTKAPFVPVWQVSSVAYRPPTPVTVGDFNAFMAGLVDRSPIDALMRERGAISAGRNEQ